MTSRMMTTTGVVLALVLLFAVNILAGRLLGPVRIDLTENRPLHPLGRNEREFSRVSTNR